MATALQIRVGLPLTGGRLVRAARSRGYPVLFSANAFARTYPANHERAESFRGFRTPDAAQFEGLDAALDSAGFVAAVRYGDYRWSVEDYFDLVKAHTWTWYSAMDYCCEPDIAGDRPLRLLRMAGTARMLGACNREARERGLPPPMPILQGWTADEYVRCADWLPLVEWPSLVGVGSVCRRPVHGPDGVLSIVEALDAVLPQTVRLHLFGVKSDALEQLAHHPRVASVDSMAWDFHARAERRVGRDMDFRIDQMQSWVERQHRRALAPRGAAGMQTMLFDPAAFGGGFEAFDELVLEAVALQHADLLMSGAVEYRDAYFDAQRDGTIAVAIVRNLGLTDVGIAELDDRIGGLGDRIEQLLLDRPGAVEYSCCRHPG